MSRRHWIAIIAVAIIVVAGALTALHLVRPRPGGPAVAPPLPATARPRVHQPPTEPVGLTLHGRVEAAQDHEVTAPREASVLALATSEGQPVAQGQLLVQLDAPALRRQLDEAQRRLAHLRALLEKANDPALRDRLEAAESFAQATAAKQEQMQAELDAFAGQNAEAATVLDTYERARAEADQADVARDRARRALDNAQKIAVSTGKPPANLNTLAAEHDAALRRCQETQARLEQARAARQRLRQQVDRLNLLRRRVGDGKTTLRQSQESLRKLRQDPAVAMIAQGRQRVQQAEAQVTRLQGEIARLGLKAPIGGLLRELRARPGRAVRAGEVLAIVAESGGPRLVCDATAAEAAKLVVGMKSRVTLADRSTFDATVSQLVPGKDATRVYLVPRARRALPAVGTTLAAAL